MNRIVGAILAAIGQSGQSRLKPFLHNLTHYSAREEYMTPQDPYVTLISSLPPHLPNLFVNKQTPISRIKLEQRLQMLEPDHAEDLAEIENLIHWDQIAISTTDEEMLIRGKQTMLRLKNPFIKEIINWRLEERTVVAALRKKHLGLNRPKPNSQWGFGRWVRIIENHWQEPDLGLGKILPWVSDAHALLADNNYSGLEYLLLNLVWNYYGQVVVGHYFDYEAVVVYVLRWNVIDRWSRYHNKAALKRLENMVESGLQNYTSLFTQTI